MRDAIYNELGYRASAGISYNKTLAKCASSQNKPNAQTVVPIRYVKLAIGSMEIAKVRFCGGKIGENLNANSIYKMHEIQGKEPHELKELAEADLDKCRWLAALAIGLCNEEVAEKGMPN